MKYITETDFAGLNLNLDIQVYFQENLSITFSDVDLRSTQTKQESKKKKKKTWCEWRESEKGRRRRCVGNKRKGMVGSLIEFHGFFFLFIGLIGFATCGFQTVKRRTLWKKYTIIDKVYVPSKIWIKQSYNM